MRNYNTLFIGKVVEHFDQLPSTNDYALSLVAKSKPSEGTVISTHNQTAGRGQIGRQWYSSPGLNLTFSLILYPNFLTIKRQFLLSQAVAIGLQEAISKLIPRDKEVYIKWPNDIYIQQKKTAGILIQNTLSSRQIQSTVVGIGMNVNESVFPTELNTATSLGLEANTSFVLEEVLSVIFSSLEAAYLSLRAGKYKSIQQKYLDKLFAWQEERWFVRKDQSSFQGKICGLAEDGRLQIETDHGVEEFAVGEIRFVIDQQ